MGQPYEIWMFFLFYWAEGTRIKFVSAAVKDSGVTVFRSVTVRLYCSFFCSPDVQSFENSDCPGNSLFLIIQCTKPKLFMMFQMWQCFKHCEF
jgi:hypothetical protein